MPLCLKFVCVMQVFHASPKLAAVESVDEAVVIGAALALSSSAFVLQLMSERGELATKFGSATLGILLLQVCTCSWLVQPSGGSIQCMGGLSYIACGHCAPMHVLVGCLCGCWVRCTGQECDVVQDIAVVPFLVLLPLVENADLAGQHGQSTMTLVASLGPTALQTLLGLGALLLGGRVVLRRIFEMVGILSLDGYGAPNVELPHCHLGSFQWLQIA